MLDFFKKLFAGGSSKNDLMNQALDNGAVLIDVRSESEYRAGHVKGSVNIPLQNLKQELPKLKNEKNIIVFCQSGARSARAKSILKQNGFQNVINGGGWRSVNQIIQDRKL